MHPHNSWIIWRNSGWVRQHPLTVAVYTQRFEGVPSATDRLGMGVQPHLTRRAYRQAFLCLRIGPAQGEDEAKT